MSETTHEGETNEARTRVLAQELVQIQARLVAMGDEASELFDKLSGGLDVTLENCTPLLGAVGRVVIATPVAQQLGDAGERALRAPAGELPTLDLSSDPGDGDDALPAFDDRGETKLADEVVGDLLARLKSGEISSDELNAEVEAWMRALNAEDVD